MNRSSSKRPSRVPPLLSLLFLSIFLSTQLSAATKICLPFQPIKRTYSSAIATTAMLPIRGGGAAKLSKTATYSPPGSANTILKSFYQTVINARSHLAAAAAARAISIFAMYPIDTIKTRMQMKQGDAFRMSGLYTGVTGSLVGQVPYGVLTFGSYEIYKKSLLNRFPNVKPAFIYALAAIMGDVTGSGWLCPSEVMKQQLQAGIYPSMSEAIKGIWKKSGVGGFYQGFTGGLARYV
mmetsp:Transcript_1231/g.2622  ORF Transcript_1231/g.2622 Transcript_1231/m.2622 type:complete len:237 (+) Transcript_1231:153-863(+)